MHQPHVYQGGHGEALESGPQLAEAVAGPILCPRPKGQPVRGPPTRLACPALAAGGALPGNTPLVPTSTPSANSVAQKGTIYRHFPSRSTGASIVSRSFLRESGRKKYRSGSSFGRLLRGARQLPV